MANNTEAQSQPSSAPQTSQANNQMVLNMNVSMPQPGLNFPTPLTQNPYGYGMP